MSFEECIKFEAFTWKRVSRRLFDFIKERLHQHKSKVALILEYSQKQKAIQYGFFIFL